MNLIRTYLFLMQGIPFTVQALEGLVQRRRGRVPHSVQGLLVQACAVHLPCPLHQVVRFVHQGRQPPLVGLAQAVEQRREIEVIVVIGNHHICPACHLLAQVIGAHFMAQGDAAQGLLIEGRAGHCGHARCGQAIIKASGQRTGVAIAGVFGIFASLVPRDQFQYPQGHRLPGRIEHLRCIERQFAPRGLGSQEQQLVELLARHGLEQRKQGADGFANPGRRLGHQAAPGTGRFVHGLGECPLPGTKLLMGKGQCAGGIIPRLPMGHFLFGPGQKQSALLLEKLLQSRC